eukprot:TRINITY_DN10070_c0_g1_i7.p1 TRINITY_DN10070_c0_g1~~TRINITY_DN10070_c0_g1_i7.p1  ORF type:complete len:371 (+),score=73.41 TRINITY_DN10070_c0_g1_i7:336-1448(+)
MGASCGGTDVDQRIYDGVGLKKNHAYAILGVAQLDDGTQLIKLRNPWGSFEWKGDWSDDSDKWTPQLRRQLNVVNSNDGVFWMSYSDFLQYFRSISVCKVQRGWQSVRLSDQFGWNRATTFGSRHMYALTTSRSTWMFLSLIQKDKRGQANEDAYRYKDMGLIIVKAKGVDICDPMHYEVVGELWPESDQIANMEILLTDTQHPYLIIPFSFHGSFDAPRPFDFVLSVYSANPVIVRRMPFRSECLISSCHLAVTHLPDSRTLFPGVEFYSTKIGDSVWFLVHNNDPDRALSINLNVQARGLSSSRSNSFEVKDQVPPMHRQLLLVLVMQDKYEGFSYSTKFSYMLGGPPVQPPHLPQFVPEDFHEPMPI